jgi:HAD superfamily hydrolase (TIGR01509 family)
MSTPSDRPADVRGAVLFDIDGTLVDSNYLHVESWSHAFADVGAAVDDWRIHRSIGMDSSKLLGALLGEDPERLGDEAKELHSRYYLELQSRLRPFAGARELLADLEGRGVPVVLATSAPEDELAALREALQVEATISDVTSAADVETAKPEPDVVHSALEKADAAASESFLVGDTVWDVEASARAGVRCIGVLSGGVSEAELREAGAIAVYEDVDQLREQLDESPLAALWR